MLEQNKTLVNKILELLIELNEDPDFKGVEFNQLKLMVKQNIRNKKLKKLKNINNENNN